MKESINFKGIYHLQGDKILVEKVYGKIKKETNKNNVPTDFYTLHPEPFKKDKFYQKIWNNEEDRVVITGKDVEEFQKAYPVFQEFKKVANNFMDSIESLLLNGELNTKTFEHTQKVMGLDKYPENWKKLMSKLVGKDAINVSNQVVQGFNEAKKPFNTETGEVK